MAKTETISPLTVSRSWLPPLDGGTADHGRADRLHGFLCALPLTLIVVNSFNTATIAEPEVYGLGAWRQAFAEPGIWRALWNSVKIGIVLQIIALPSGIFISWLLARTNIYGANAFEFGFWISFILPNLATTFGWMLMLDPSTGLINNWLRQLPLWRTQLRHLFFLGHHLGPCHGQRHLHQSDVVDAGVSAHGRVDGRSEPDVRRERADDACGASPFRP